MNVETFCLYFFCSEIVCMCVCVLEGTIEGPKVNLIVRAGERENALTLTQRLFIVFNGL